MRADYLVCYDTAGRPHLVMASPDSPFVVSAYVEHGSCVAWHFGYTRREQQGIAEMINGDSTIRRAVLFTWFDAVDPHLEGHQPAVHLDLIITGTTGWAKFATEERDDGWPVALLTVDEHNPAPSAVCLGSREVYADQPYLPAERIRAAGAEYVRTGRLPESVAWQRRASLVPQGPFGRRLVAEEDLPPQLDWSYPKQAQPWAYDPSPLFVS